MAVEQIPRRAKARDWRTILGPGLIAGASDDDPSGIATYSQAGAQLGFAISWTMLFSYPLMVAIQEISARIGRVTGSGIVAFGAAAVVFGLLHMYQGPQGILFAFLLGLVFAATLRAGHVPLITRVALRVHGGRMPEAQHAYTRRVTQAWVMYFVCMALGQLIGGPVSDQRGRRRPLIAAVLVMTAASVVCALTSTIGLMMAARFVQGFSGGWAMVIGRAVIVDLATAARLVRVLNVIAGVGGLAPSSGRCWVR